MPVYEVRTHFTPGGHPIHVNRRKVADGKAPHRRKAGLGGNNFPPALSSERAVMVKNAGHPYYLEGGAKK